MVLDISPIHEVSTTGLSLSYNKDLNSYVFSYLACCTIPEKKKVDSMINAFIRSPSKALSWIWAISKRDTDQQQLVEMLKKLIL